MVNIVKSFRLKSVPVAVLLLVRTLFRIAAIPQVTDGIDFKGKPARNVALLNATIDFVPFIEVQSRVR